MEIDLCLAAQEEEGLRRFLERDVPVIRKWHEMVYRPDLASWSMGDYVARIQKDHLWMLDLAFSIDKLHGAKLTLGYFREIFRIPFEVEISLVDAELFEAEDHDVRMVYESDLDITHNVILCPKVLIPKYVLEVAPTKLFIPAMAHEIWHAHQDAIIVDWLKESGGILDLEEINPRSKDARGALYLFNKLVYMVHEQVGMELYLNQLLEAEAYTITKYVSGLV